MLPDVVRLGFSEEPGRSDLAGTDAVAWTLGLVPKIPVLGRGEGLKILVLLEGDPPKILPGRV